MENSLAVKKQRVSEVTTNAVSGSYRPHFFDLEEFNLSKVEYESLFFNKEDVERSLLEGEFSFAYLREDKLRTIAVVDKDDRQVRFSEFLKRFGINVKSQNLFKTGKYLSRVFRPIRYGCFYKDLDIHVNHNPEYKGAITDGISLISLDLAKSLGWKNAEPNSSAQFTLFYKGGLVKGHCVLSSKINHDVVIYGEDNIKQEISLNNGLEYVALEPVKLGKSLRLDIQSLLNLWGLFGGDQYLRWAQAGIEKFKSDLFAGRLKDWLDNIDEISGEDYDREKWTLRKAVYHGIDYRRFPGLLRASWTMFRNSMITFAENSNGNPVFRIPVPGGRRGYLRVDLRDHDEHGNFRSTVRRGEIELDQYGNVWVHPSDTSVTFDTLGGADQDDNLAIIPVEGNKAVIYRNPNQYGEYSIFPIKYSGVVVKNANKLVGVIPMKIASPKTVENNSSNSTGNNILNSLLATLETAPNYITYNRTNLLRTYSSIEGNATNVGLAANAEMIRSSIGIVDSQLLAKLIKEFSWNLERIIDSTVKDGVSSEEDMRSVNDLLSYVVENKLSIPKSIVHRLPKSLREDAALAEQHPLDELFEAIKFLIEKADLEIVGRGSVSRGNRIQGMIDHLDIPVIQIGLSNVNNPMHDIAMQLMKRYNKSMAIMLDKSSNLPVNERVFARRNGIEQIQKELLLRLAEFSIEERALISNVFAFEIYKGNRSVHDSILWLRDMEELRGTASDTIKMLADIGIAQQVKKNGTVERYYQKKLTPVKVDHIRIWSKESTAFDDFNSAREMLIESGDVLIDDHVFKIGDECQIHDGIYSVKCVARSVSRKNSKSFLKNSITVYIQ